VTSSCDDVDIAFATRMARTPCERKRADQRVVVAADVVDAGPLDLELAQQPRLQHPAAAPGSGSRGTTTHSPSVLWRTGAAARR
jgi:hypothetical protein